MTAEQFNAANVGKLWQPEQLPPVLAGLWRAGATNFAVGVRALQATLGLPADGKLGPATLARLGSGGGAPPTIYGFDVSGYQNRDGFDFAALAKAGQSFAWVKATQEQHAANADAQWQFDEFVRAGIVTGFYHFGDVSEPAKAQAEVFIARCNAISKSLPVLGYALDLEWYKDHNAKPDADFRAWTVAFLDRVRELTGRDPVLYVGPSFWAEHMAGKPLALNGTVHLWVVDYSHPEASPTLPPGFTTWTFRQFTGSGSIGGYKGAIDRNTFNGSLADLQAFVRAGA